MKSMPCLRKNEYDVYHFHRLFQSVYSTILLPSSRKPGAGKRFVPEDLPFLAVAHPTGEVYNEKSDKISINCHGGCS